jgi:hypothetical protein
MLTFTIADPHDRENPIPEVSSGGALIYHGTHSMFSPFIEQQGFCYDGFNSAFGAAIRAIVAACDQLNFKPLGCAAASGFSDKNFVYFSASFRAARIAGERRSGKNIKLNKIVAGSHLRKYLFV